MERVTLTIPELADMRHIITDGLHIINNAAVDTNVYFILGAATKQSDILEEGEKA